MTTNDFGGAAKKKRQDALGPGMNKHFELKNGGTGWEDELLFQLGDFLGEPAVNVPGMYTNKV